MTTNSSSPPLSLPHQDPEFPHTQNPSTLTPHEKTLEEESQSSPQNPDQSQKTHQQEAQEEIVDHEGEEEEEEDKSGLMSKSGISSSSLSPPPLTIPPNTDQEPNPRSLTSPTSLSRRPNNKRKKGGPKKQKAIEKKVQTLVENLRPIPFKPSKVLNFGKHERLLRRLGLCDFVHIEFDRDVRVDLIAQLVANYESRSQREELFREEVGVEAKEEDDGDLEMWQESKGEAEAEVKEQI